VAEDLLIAGIPHKWGQLRLREHDSPGWAHHDVAVLHNGSLVAAHPEGGRMHIRTPAGSPREVATSLTEAHELAPTGTGAAQRLWVCDNGHKFVPAQPEYDAVVTRGRVVLMTLSGWIEHELDQPDIEAYETTGWMPGAIVIDEPADGGGSGQLWVADCYAHNLVHCYASAGDHQYTLDGAESGRTFSKPHALHIDRRRSNPELCIADRGNHRLVLYDMNGTYLRTAAEAALSSPSGLATTGDNLLVTELNGALVILDGRDHLIGRVGDSAQPERTGWSNRVNNGTTTAPTPPPGRFNSPHAITTDTHGTIYISEWFIGGRITQLTPQP
jgi:hypothetical protein